MRQVFIFIISSFIATYSFSQDHNGHGNEHNGDEKEKPYDPSGTAFHHIADANVYTIGPWSFPLPCILYAPEKGLSVFSSSKFGIGHHGDGHYAIEGYVLNGGSVMRVKDPSFPQTKEEIDTFTHKKGQDAKGKEIELPQVIYRGQKYDLDKKSTMDGGLLGGGITSFYDFSITKNVLTMILVSLFLAWLFITSARAYQKRGDKAPTGIQGFLEPMFQFIQDEVSKPFIGPKWEKYNPFIQALFFFILGLNLFGQIPFFGGSNVTGNLAVTMVLAILAFIVTNISGNRHYWQHIFWMPGIPAAVKTIVTPVEFMGLFIKPFTLMLRLFANITAGHMVVLSFIGLIFIFGDKGAFEWGVGREAGSAVGMVLAVILTLFMMAIELLVAFIQAFVFALLTASYIGAAVEEHHHAEEHH